MASGSDESEEHLSPKEMQNWLQSESERVNRASELRLKEATAFVNAYVNGEISGNDAEDRLWKYDQRWGEALPGIMSPKGLTDEQVVAAIDETRRPDFASRLGEKTDRFLREKRTGAGDMER